MMSRAVLAKWSWLFALVLTMGLMACSSDDGGGSTDTTVDRGSDVDRDVPTSDTPTPDASQDSIIDLPIQDQSGDQGGTICDQIGAATGVGNACDAEATDPQCGQGGICADLGAGPVCWQVCVPGTCDALCTIASESCLNVVDEDGNPIEIQPGIPLGVCGELPAGTQGAYDACGTADTGSCESGLSCISLTGIDGALPMCVPECGTGGTCPDRESVAGQCALGAGGDPTHCALACDPVGSATCPTGMDCFTVTGGGICLWPES